ncbi:MAG: GDSL-type esterase/lipase family protein [Nannocystaceae bacterium]
MRRGSLQARGRAWVAGLVAFSVVGCGPLGGCGSGSVQGAEPERPEEGHPVLVEGPSPGPAVAVAAKAAAAEPRAPEFAAEAVAAREVALGALGEEGGFGEYATKLPELPPIADPGDPQLANLDALPGSRGGGDGDGAAAPTIDGNALGIFVPLENAGALDHFYAALRRLRAGEDEDGKVRVLLYGASHTAADIYPTYLRSYLSERFGDGGPGYVSLIQTNRWYRLLAWTVDSSKHWKVEHAQRRDAREDGLFGLLGCSGASKRKAAKSVLTPKISGPGDADKTTYDLYFLAQPGGGKFTATFGGDAKPVKKTIKTKAKDPGPGYATFTLDGGPRQLEVRPTGDGEVRLFGMTVEYDRPGVVVDTLGINGTRAANNLKWDEAIWADNVRRRAPDLIVLAYGTNEATDSDQPIEAYRRSLVEVLDRLRSAAPEASCVLMGPGDFPLKDATGVYGARPRVPEIVAAQREIAEAKGCAFWDALAFMGGEGSMPLWVQSTPAMGRGDHIHLTRRGYVRLGMAFTDALMQGFD